MEKLTPGKLVDSKLSPTTAAPSPSPLWTSAARSRNPRQGARRRADPTLKSSRPSSPAYSPNTLLRSSSTLARPPRLRAPQRKGLLLAYEKTGYDATPRRPPDLRRLERSPPRKPARRCNGIPSTTPPSRRPWSTISSTHGSSESETSAPPTTSPSSSIRRYMTPMAAMKISRLRQGSRTSSPAPWPSSARPATTSTC
jgi:hypothetical protein